jgi:hypothetical protein
VNRYWAQWDKDDLDEWQGIRKEEKEEYTQEDTALECSEEVTLDYFGMSWRDFI